MQNPQHTVSFATGYVSGEKAPGQKWSPYIKQYLPVDMH